MLNSQIILRLFILLHSVRSKCENKERKKNEISKIPKVMKATCWCKLSFSVLEVRLSASVLAKQFNCNLYKYYSYQCPEYDKMSKFITSYVKFYCIYQSFYESNWLYIRNCTNIAPKTSKSATSLLYFFKSMSCSFRINITLSLTNRKHEWNFWFTDKLYHGKERCKDCFYQNN